MSNTISKLEEIFLEVLELDEITLLREDTANDVDGWDSLNHIYIVVEIEKQFGIKFKSQQILMWKNVGDIVDDIEKLIAS